jgi:ATP/maltotriose-dependent transcriptional regulator MalT
MGGLIDALGSQGKYPEVTRCLGEIAERPAEPELLNPWLECMVCATAYLSQAGDQGRRDRLMILLEEAKDKLEPLLVGRTSTLSAHRARMAGKWSLTLAQFQWAAEHYERLGNRRAASEALANLGQTFLLIGQFERAEECMRRQIEMAQRLGLGAMIPGSMANLGLVLAYQGRLDQARDTGRQANAMLVDLGIPYFLACTEAYQSIIEFLSGDFVLAEQYAIAAAAHWETMAPSRPFALGLWARAVLGQGRASEALLHAREAYEQLKTLGTLDEGDAIVRLAMAESLLASGDGAAAKSVLAEARKSIEAVADGLDGPAERTSFMTRIPENRRITELCEELGCDLG